MTKTDTAATPNGSGDFVLPGWADQPAASPKKKPSTEKPVKLKREPKRPRDKKAAVAKAPVSMTASRPRWQKTLAGVVVGLLAVTGCAGIALGFAAAGQVDYAPVPDDTVRATADGPIAGPDGHEAVDTNDGAMTVEKMEPQHYFIPALGVYSQIVPSSQFDTTRYTSFQGLKIPRDPAQSAWYSPAGALAANEPGTEGTTLLASHVAANGSWGVLRELYTLQGGELVYITDAEGSLSAWKVIELRTLMHTEFPQDYWDADGIRRLVITTCGDYDSRKGFYTKNIFAIATPVDPVTGQPMPEE